MRTPHTGVGTSDSALPALRAVGWFESGCLIVALLWGMVLLVPGQLAAQTGQCYRHTFLNDKPNEETPAGTSRRRA